jgi:hypothetical protein
VIKTRLQSRLPSNFPTALVLLTFLSSSRHIKYSREQYYCTALLNPYQSPCSSLISRPYTQSAWQCKLMGDLLLLQIRN